MRILLLNHNVAFSGGTFHRAYQTGRQLALRGHDVDLLSISPKRRIGFETYIREGVRIVETPDLLWGVGRTGWDPWDTLSRLTYLRGKSWDIVHAWDCRPAVILPALYAAKLSESTGGRLVIDWCDWWGRGGTINERSGLLVRALFGPVETYFEEAFRTKADGTTVISDALRCRARRLGVPNASILLLRQGCDVDGVVPLNRHDARQRIGIDPSIELVGHLGALIRSDASLLFSSFRRLLRERPHTTLVLIGNHRSAVPADLRATGRIIETGFLAREVLDDWVAACDVMTAALADTIASRARWPSKANHSLAAGRANVLTRVGDLAELLERENAAVLANCDPGDLSDKIALLLNNADLRGQVERQGREVAERLLDWRIIISQLIDFYNMVKVST